MENDTGMQVRRMVKALLLASINQQGRDLDGYDTARTPQVELGGSGEHENYLLIRVPWPFVVRLGALYEAFNVISAEVSVDPARGGQQGVTLQFTFCTILFRADIGLAYDEI